MKELPIYLRIRKADGAYRYVKVVKAANGKIRPLYGMVDGRAEHHPEGEYNVRVVSNGKRSWHSVGQDPNAAIATAHRMAANRLEGPASPQLVVMPSLPESPDGKRHDIDASIATYIAEVKAGTRKATL